MSRDSAIFTIPARLSLVDTLAKGLLVQYGHNPLALGRLTVFLPTRRAARTLREAFLRQGEGNANILPRILPLGGIEDDDPALAGVLPGAQGENLPPAMEPLERSFMLASLVRRAHRHPDGRELELPQAFLLATELGRLLDRLQTEGRPVAALSDIVDEDFTAHWQVTTDFLKIIGHAWPAILADENRLDAVERRNQILQALARHWKEDPPEHPVIAAGSTGSVPATAALLNTIAHMPQGQVILPGFDQSMDEKSWNALDPTHPQAGMQNLLQSLQVDRTEVLLWPGLEDAEEDNTYLARQVLLNEAMRPAATTAKWSEWPQNDTPSAMQGLYRLDAESPRHEAEAIALVMRETLETPGKTAVLITPDRDLARRTAASLRRWDINIDDSAGTPLVEAPVAIFLRLVIDMVQQDFAPIPLLACLKHPFCTMGLEPGQVRRYAMDMERHVLRGPRPAPGPNGILTAPGASRIEETTKEWWETFTKCCNPLIELMQQDEAPLTAMATAHIKVCETLAKTNETEGSERLWAGQDGEALARFFDQLMGLASNLEDRESIRPLLAPHDYLALLESALHGETIRPQWGTHPRLSILGPMEARLHHADVTILGGLNEGSWPPDAGNDPWLSRPMKDQVGLPQPEQRIGLSAHDFVHAASAGDVYFGRAIRQGGAETLPSRWLLRLNALIPEHAWTQAPHAIWAHILQEAGPGSPVSPPEPKPPVELRPTELSATRIEAWMRDPYGIYAQKILKLPVLADLDEEPGAAEQGTFVHDALELFLEETNDPHNPDALARLLEIGAQQLDSIGLQAGARAFWWPRFEQIAAWFIEQQKERQGDFVPTAIESTGKYVLTTPKGHRFTATAKADRIDRMADGTFDIIDYKTGQPPSIEQVNAGYAPQLPVEGMILQAGGFPEIPDGDVGEMSYWQLRGGKDGSRIASLSRRRDQTPVPDLIAEAEEGLSVLVDKFADADTPYRSNPNPTYRGWGDYDHLARVKEWEGKSDDGCA